MLKQSMVFVIISIIVVFIKKFLAQLLHGLLELQHKLQIWLGTVFSHDHMGEMIKAVLSLIIIPLIIGVIAVLVLSLSKRKPMPYVMVITWGIWLVLLTAMLLPIK